MDDFELSIGGYEKPVVYPEDVLLSAVVVSDLSDYITFEWFKGDTVVGAQTYRVSGV